MTKIVFDSGGERTLSVETLSEPDEDGDVLYIDTDDDDGYVWALNPREVALLRTLLLENLP